MELSLVFIVYCRVINSPNKSIYTALFKYLGLISGGLFIPFFVESIIITHASGPVLFLHRTFITLRVYNVCLNVYLGDKMRILCPENTFYTHFGLQHLSFDISIGFGLYKYYLCEQMNCTILIINAKQLSQQ